MDSNGTDISGCGWMVKGQRRQQKIARLSRVQVGLGERGLCRNAFCVKIVKWMVSTGVASCWYWNTFTWCSELLPSKLTRPIVCQQLFSAALCPLACAAPIHSSICPDITPTIRGEWAVRFKQESFHCSSTGHASRLAREDCGFSARSSRSFSRSFSWSMHGHGCRKIQSWSSA